MRANGETWLRVAARGIGEVLVWTAVLIFGFAAWQLWATGLIEQQAQDRLAVEFTATSSPTSASPATTDLATSTTAVTTTAPPVTEPATEPTEGTPTTVGAATTAPAPDTTIETITSSTVVPSEQTSASNWFKVSIGDPVARIQIASAGVDAYVVAGATRATLQQGPGHWPTTPLPGQTGNSVIYGHRTTYGAVFENLDRMQLGDEIAVQLPNGDQYVYSVTGTEILSPDDVWSASNQGDATELTLVTCTPKYTSDSRLVVHSTLIAARSAVPWQAPPSPLVQYTDYTVTRPVAVAPGEPAVEVEVVDEVTGRTVTVTVPSRLADADLTVVDGEVVERVPSDEAAAADVATVDEWFADRAATLESAGWLAMFVLVILAARMIGRRLAARRPERRRVYLAAVAAAATVVALPLLWALYEAFNKVMPAAL